MTHDPKIDDPAIDAALHAGCFYVGALGSRKTHAKRVERLAALGHGPDAIGRIAAPIGLAIGRRALRRSRCRSSPRSSVRCGSAAPWRCREVRRGPSRGRRGAILAHAVRGAEKRRAQGLAHRPAEIAALAAAGVSEVVVARLEPGDVDENTAAERLAIALAGPHTVREAPFTGRVNLFAEVAGVLMVDADAIDAATRSTRRSRSRRSNGSGRSSPAK